MARAAAHEASLLAVTVGRFAVAALALVPAWLLLERRRGFRARRSDAPLLLGMALTGIVGYTVLFLTGIALAPATDGAVITPALAGIFGMLLACPALGKRPTRSEALGALLALPGVVLVGWSVLRAAGPGSQRVAGGMLFVASAAVWGVSTVLGKRAADRIPAATGLLPASARGALLFARVVAVVQAPRAFLAWSPPAWTNVLDLGLVATAVSFVTFSLGLERVGVARAAPFFGLVPPFAVLEAAWVLGEELTALHALGGALVVAGIDLPSVLARHAARAPPPEAGAAAGPPLTG